MKKTKKTMFTAALLSSAVALQSNIPSSTQASDDIYLTSVMYGPPPTSSPEPSAVPTVVPMYGPPSVKGDLDGDGDADITDYILLKSRIGDSEALNLTARDYWTMNVNWDDQLSAEDIKTFERYLFGKIPDMDRPYPEDYDDNPEYIPDNPAVIPTEYPQTKYGPYPADPDDDPSQPPVYASVYGPPPVLNTEIPEPVYGAPVAAEEEE